MGFYFSPGKLLLTSEYLVLDGALALAVPTKLGQDLQATEVENGKSKILWEAAHQGKPWLAVEINYQNWQILHCNVPDAGVFIFKLLQHIQNLSGTVLQNAHSYHLKTNLEFPADYGWGSSSTLMNNVAAWAKINPYNLNDLALGGSGYDIAVANENAAVLYQIGKDRERIIRKVAFQPHFSDDLLLVHLNQKQNSREGIALYKSKPKSAGLITEFSDLTTKILSAKNTVEFSALMEIHEQALAQFLKIPTVKEKYFKDCPVFVKSLGAWGGDFVLTLKFDGWENYFLDKGFPVVLAWKNVIG